ncbi:MAG: hypothetical protein ACKOPQ_09735 [Novosphingobium sp.]|jgi:hypothetical protein
MIRRKLHKLAAISALFSFSSAQAAEPAACFKRDEVRSIVAFLMPVALDPAIKSCKAHLASDSYLLTGGQQLQDSLAKNKDAEWSKAKTAFLRVFDDGARKMPDMPDELLRTMLEAKFGSEILGKMSADDCKDFSNIAARLAPLSPDALVDLVAEIGVVALRSDKKARGFNICPGA